MCMSSGVADVDVVDCSTLYALNNKHQVVNTSTSAVRCLICSDTLIVRSNATCRCSNVGAILDNDNTLRVYVQDINTIHLGVAILNANGVHIKTHWADYSELIPKVPYSDVISKGILFNDNKSSKSGKSSKDTPKPSYNQMCSLIEALDLSNDTKGRAFFYDTKK